MYLYIYIYIYMFIYMYILRYGAYHLVKFLRKLGLGPGQPQARPGHTWPGQTWTIYLYIYAEST